MSFQDIFGNAKFVAKLDVSNLDASVSFYAEKLGFQLDEKYRTSNWAQLNIPESDVAIGLDASHGTHLGGCVPTFLVDNIETARQNLIDKGVEVGPIEEPGDGVRLAKFKDPDGNELMLRQNPLT